MKSGYLYYRNQAANTTTTTTSSHHTKPDLWKFIWKSNTLPRVKQFLWNACQNAIPTVDNLHRRRIVPDPLCPICKKEAETIKHALFLCPWTVKIWRANPLKFDLITTTMWCIWKDRNRFVFEHHPLHPQQTTHRWQPPHSDALSINIDASFVWDEGVASDLEEISQVAENRGVTEAIVVWDDSREPN